MRWIATGLVTAFALGAQASQHVRKPLPSQGEIAKLPPDGGPEFNRLVFEKSPYLLQHARNPVDWYPWGAEAFERAAKEDKPIFLSVGYSTCHWCHVMERESFEDAEVAALLNASFVCIKVDREERPDVDQVYMAVTQAMTGSGGWPMTVVMTPGKKPFFAGTYFPKSAMAGRPGLMEIVPKLVEAWKTQRQEIAAHADQVAAWLSGSLAGAPGDPLAPSTLETAARELASRFDSAEGGFDSAPKFPLPHQVRLLLRWWRRSGDAHALEMAERTLQAMARGGIRDHLGGGFHRYSTDRRWLVPHFEKMLYDQALVALAYVEAFEATRKDEYRDVAREIFGYVLRDLTSPEGGFYSAEDADSEGVEGKFYRWSPAELAAVLGDEDGTLFARVYGVTPAGNLRESRGESVLHLEQPEKGAEAGLRAWLAASRAKLFAAREGRVRPLRDDKVLADWNGLMIAALAHGARAFDEPAYAGAARRAAEFVLSKLRDDKGRLLKRWRQGEAAHAAVLEDHAFLCWGLIELYETDFDVRWLSEAIRLADEMSARFWDGKDGGFFFTAGDAEALLARGKEAYDGAIPSGNSVAALDLLLLAHLTGRTEFLQQTQRLFKAFSGEIARGPSRYSQMLIALDLSAGPASEIVIAGEPGREDARAMLRAVRSRFLPNTVVILRPEGDDPPIAKLAEFVREQRGLGARRRPTYAGTFPARRPSPTSRRSRSGSTRADAPHRGSRKWCARRRRRALSAWNLPLRMCEINRSRKSIGRTVP